jgi:hypothetical protein
MSAARVVEHMAVVWNPEKRNPLFATESIVGVEISDP